MKLLPLFTFVKDKLLVWNWKRLIVVGVLAMVIVFAYAIRGCVV